MFIKTFVASNAPQNKSATLNLIKNWSGASMSCHEGSVKRPYIVGIGF